MKRSTVHIAIGLIFFSVEALSQERSTFSTDHVLECIAESYADELGDEADLSNMLDELERFIVSPININLTTRDELERLRLLNGSQIETLLAYRDKMGQIYSQQELLNLDGFNEKLVDDLSVFITFLPPVAKSQKYFRSELNLRSQFNFEKASGFKADENGEKKFFGIEPKLYLNYRAEKDGRFDLGLTAENDAGEQFFSGNNQAGFDFYSGFLGFKGTKVVRKIYLGDFQIKTGQGLMFWSGYGGRKSSEATKIRFSGQGIRPYSSTTEYGFFRGVATQINMKPFDMIAFYSNKNADANISGYDEENNPITVSSLQTSGYHRTESEVSDKNSMNIQTTGFGVKFNRNRFAVSINGGYQKYNISLEPTEHLYNQYYFRGKENYNIGADYVWILNRINFFGEAVISKSGGTAFVSGIEANPSNDVSVSVLFRDYKKDFHPINSSSFSEFGTGTNERGIYTGISCYAFPKMTITSYIDLYESYWIKFNSIKPVNGYDFMFQTSYALKSNMEIYFRFKTESRNENSSLTSTIKKDAILHTNRARLNIEWDATENFNFRFRAEWSGIEKEDSLNQGLLILSDASYMTDNEKITATARLAWFNTNNYDSRIYAYENDVPSSFYIPSYYLNGCRFYFNLKYKVLKNTSIYLKFSQTRYFNNTSLVGTGNLQIEGNHKTEFKVQLRFLF